MQILVNTQTTIRSCPVGLKLWCDNVNNRLFVLHFRIHDNYYKFILGINYHFFTIAIQIISKIYSGFLITHTPLLEAKVVTEDVHPRSRTLAKKKFPLELRSIRNQLLVTMWKKNKERSNMALERILKSWRSARANLTFWYLNCSLSDSLQLSWHGDSAPHFAYQEALPDIGIFCNFSFIWPSFSSLTSKYFSTQSLYQSLTLFYNVFSYFMDSPPGSYLIRLHIVYISINLQLLVRILVYRTNRKYSMWLSKT